MQENGSVTVIVLGLTPQGLSVLRVLSRRGVNVYAFGTSEKQVGYHSRYGIKKIFHSVLELKTSIGTILSDLSYKPLCYITSGEILALVLRDYPELYQQCDVISSPFDVVNKLAHKDQMYAMAIRCGFKVADYVTLDRYNSNILSFPLFVKRNYEVSLGFKTAIVNDAQELTRLCDKIPQIRRPDVLLQQIISIPKSDLLEVSAQCFFSRGKLRGCLVADQRRRLKKGLTSYLVELPHDNFFTKISELTQSFMSGLNYTGFAEFEFMYDKRNRLLYFIEVNTRTCGLQSSLDCKFSNIGDVMLNPYNAPMLQERKGLIHWMNIQRDIRVRFESRDFSNLGAIFSSSFDVFDVKDIKPFIFQFV